MSKARYFQNPTLIDILPEGVSTTKDTIVRGVYSTGPMIKSFEILKDFQGTGREAIRVNFLSGYEYEIRGGDKNVPEQLQITINNLVINNKIIPTSAETKEFNNDNHVYFFFDNGQTFPEEISSSNLVNDVFDLNKNGKTDDKVLMATSKVIGNAPESIYSLKYIRSLEPIDGSDTLNTNTIWEDQIMTGYADNTNSAGRFQYDLRVMNYYDQELDSLVIYDVFPHIGDLYVNETPRNSKFSNTLVAPIRVTNGKEDITDWFDIFYRTDKYLSADVKVEIASNLIQKIIQLLRRLN